MSWDVKGEWGVDTVKMERTLLLKKAESEKVEQAVWRHMLEDFLSPVPLLMHFIFVGGSLLLE